MKKSIEWKSPKQYQPGWKIDDESKPIPSKPPKPRSKYCKKLKGDHQFGPWQVHYYGFEKNPKEITGSWIKYCKACNKQQMWFAPRRKDSHYFDYDLDARPPGYEELSNG